METLLSQDGPLWLLAGLSITVVPLLVVGIVARVLLKMNFVVLSGLIAGSMTDPPALAFANTLMKSDAPSVSYAAVYPLTMLLRILCAHFLSCSSSSQGRKESPIITTIACFQGEHCATSERPMRRKRLPAALSLVSRAS